jgi:hypothetical protein
MIQSRPYIFFFLLALSLSCYVTAQEIQENQKITEEVDLLPKRKLKKTKKRSFFVGAEIRNYNYSEPGFVSHDGILYGGNLEYIQIIISPKLSEAGYSILGTAYSAGGQVLTGILKYDGGLCDINGNCVPYKADTSNLIFRLYGKFHFLPNNYFSFNLGLGYRHLIDKGEGVGFYLRTGSWVYLPIAVEVKPEIKKNYKLYFASEFDFLLSGGLKSNLSEVDSKYADVYMDQKGNGLILKAGFEYKTLRLNLVYETWNLDESGVVESGGDQFVEPKNSSNSLGIQINFDLL